VRFPWPLAPALVLTGCGLATHVRPVPPGALQVEAAVGGPVAVIGAPVPLPLSTAGARYGVLPRWDIGAHVHLTTLLALGTPGLDVETNVLALEESGPIPAVSFTARGYAFTDLRSGVQLDWDLGVTVSRTFSERWLVFFNLVRQQQYDGAGPWSVAIGGRLSFTPAPAGLQLELRVFDLFQPTAGSSIPWVSPFSHGALGVVLGADWEVVRLRTAP